MTTHRLLDHDVTPVEVAEGDATATHAMATGRLKALTATTDRLTILAAACAEVERWCGRVLWGPSPRVSTSLVEVGEVEDPVHVVPRFPVLTGVGLAITTVKLWDEQAAAFTDVDDYVLLPRGRIRVRAPGDYELVVALTPAAVIPPVALEAAGRLFGYREQVRTPDESAGGGGEGAFLANAMYRCGAASLLRSLKHNAQS